MGVSNTMTVEVTGNHCCKLPQVSSSFAKLSILDAVYSNDHVKSLQLNFSPLATYIPPGAQSIQVGRVSASGWTNEDAAN